MADARSLVAALLAEGVREVVLCPGSRSAPLAEALADAADAGRLRLRVVLDERSAGFIALGVARAHALNGHSRCAAVVTTSGTAVSNLHPAVSEADAAGIPLLVISADRPHELVGTGASQTTEQTKLFVPALRLGVDLPADLAADLGGHAADAAIAGQVRRAVAAATGTLSRDPGPAQINARFRPPLTAEGAVEGAAEDTAEDAVPLAPAPPSPPAATAAPAAVPACAPEAGAGRPAGSGSSAQGRGIVVAGDTAHPAVGSMARSLAEHLNWPLLAEPTSQARSGPQALSRYAELLGTPAGRALAQQAEHLLVLGHPSLSRSITALLGREDLNVTVLTECARWTDVSGRARRVVPMDGPDHQPDDAALRSARLVASLGLESADAAWTDSWRRAVADLPEPDRSSSGDALARAVWEASQAPGAPTLLLGSSMTVRRLDRLAQPGAAAPKAVANRGLAGIDGTIATGIGLWMASGEPVRAVMGDLAFLHDAMSLNRGVREEEADLQVIVVDDGGGAIFSHLEYARTTPAGRFERLFTAPQRADIAALAAALGARVHVPDDVEALRGLLAEPVDGVSVVVWETTRHGPHTVTT
ncbi:2-succinyl-5-enolpyruvyl-6-hydroxy-3-cyclohexene-1-carboxylic-acid synthase [Actinomyces oris]|uniref:2-succinyl-5-enolpyruvyl-6-hydroxy-3- cyclohexene-1-carboxylic-acid synthase n=1 Tax=Actinomyces TaxID=1654 RepID=UPI000949C8E0|nr:MULTISPECIES: 2-succinyl-5-enolpyruvyl-6-hydroxy-3-cyclohexene-1-carboxylic-acid synthase [Actinomyces]OLL12275.1 2-succinyl-5-enolpyruvyl-6-hydroxy-3-cyclohexene-1-carboxylic-acid synthase [Actinomyces oris]QLF54691.1 2-succinyl-5-enolpyruvyl-6-hydroxy-3-cyclohexene-1-carboxylic-acid synthase [Actinomyces sp. oral taxon 169]